MVLITLGGIHVHPRPRRGDAGALLPPPHDPGVLASALVELLHVLGQG